MQRYHSLGIVFFMKLYSGHCFKGSFHLTHEQYTKAEVYFQEVCWGSCLFALFRFNHPVISMFLRRSSFPVHPLVCIVHYYFVAFIVAKMQITK